MSTPSNLRRWSVVLFCLLLPGSFVGSSLAAAELPPDDVLKLLPAPSANALRAGATKLDVTLATLESDVTVFHSDCRHVASDDTEKNSECRLRWSQLARRASDLEDSNAQFKREVRDAVEAEIKARSARAERTMQELKKVSIRLQGYQGAVAEWSTLAADARASAQKQAMLTVATVLTEGLLSSNQNQTKLNEDARQRIDALIERGILGQPWISQIPAMRADVVARLASMRNDQDVLRLLATINQALQAAPNPNDPDVTRAAVIALRCLDVVNRDPRITMLISVGEVWIDAAYGWLAGGMAKQRIEQVLALDEQDLRAVGQLTALYKADINTLSRLRAFQVP